jgi:thermostable 8-oxoguanine DNA glycosylase
VENGVNDQLRLCCEKLERLAKTIEHYTRSCMKQRGTRTSRDQMNKKKWILKKEDAEPLQRDLLILIQGLGAYTSTLGM